MQNINRREFVTTGAAALGAGLQLAAAPLDLPIGCQVYPVREALAEDFDGTLRQLAGIGYKAIEMCSPPGYERGGFAPLVGMKAAEMRQRIQNAGLSCESCHYTMRELRESLDDRIRFAEELGLKQMVLASFAVPKNANLAQWTQAAEELNKFAAQISKAGLRTVFHNHNIEFEKIEGALIYDRLMSTLDRKLVGMQFQVAVISMGFEGPDLFQKYPGRFVSMHLQDWSPSEKKTVAVGKGVVDWKALFFAAKTAGVKNYFVELNLDQMRDSYPYLRNLKV